MRLYYERCKADTGQWLPIHSAPVQTNVRCSSNSDRFLRRSEMTLSANSGHHRRSTNAASEWLKADCELCPELRTLKIVKIQVGIGVGGRTTGDLWLEGRIESDLFIYFPQHCRSRVKGVPDIVVQPCGVKCRQVPHFNTRKQLR